MQASSSDADPFKTLSSAFAERIQELKRFTYLRIEDGSKHLFDRELQSLQASVRALEEQAAELKQYIAKEHATMPKVQAVIQACKLQSNHLQILSAGVPASLTSSSQRRSAAGGPDVSDSRADQTRPATSGTASHASSTNRTTADDVVRKRDQPPPAPPRWLVTDVDLQGVSSYLRGRLTLDKVNAAIEEMAVHAEANSRLLAAARSQGSKMPPADRKRAIELLHSVASKDALKGQHWFIDTDLKDGVALKMDKTGKSLITLLRHLQRISEVRCTLDGTSTVVYVLHARQG